MSVLEVLGIRAMEKVFFERVAAFKWRDGLRVRLERRRGIGVDGGGSGVGHDGRNGNLVVVVVWSQPG